MFYRVKSADEEDLKYGGCLIDLSSIAKVSNPHEERKYVPNSKHLPDMDTLVTWQFEIMWKYRSDYKIFNYPTKAECEDAYQGLINALKDTFGISVKDMLTINDLEERLRKYTCEIINLNDKLQKYKNIEEELGIDLMTLFEALRDGIYVNEDYCDYGTTDNFLAPDNLDFDLKLKKFNTSLFLKDYGKTWALTRDKLL